ncbi:glycine/D-amino acid oxidase, deaminating [Acidovorax sp. CF316]|uniref:NAD(P)/FAD-dependent oxidoreductase n=1 Tax=Acidovorax sp. CF316 TaxID=1144317 RepID=UPI00026BE48F|nr:FAD-binding oxidoreductase [Acidovorax sp. CF316]EJE54877.1 glycine/D-amino acid oxidase, deaminating [Acidovorax sp. CF316]
MPIVIIGGGVIGSAIAYELTRQQPGCEVVVVERDPGYARASSALSASSIRQQFSTDINVQISAHGIGFLRNVDTLLACNGDVPHIGLHEGGYLYLATAAGEATLRDNHGLQKRHGADVALLTADELATRFPWLALQDVVLGSLGLSGEGWFDGYLLLTALRRKAQSQGVRYVADEAVGLDMSASDGVQHVTAVQLKSGTTLPCSRAVNAGGPWAAAIAGWAGIALPVVGKRRTVFHLSSPAPLPRCPLLIDTSGIWLRPEGSGFIAGFAPPADQDADFAPLEPEYHAFEEHVWPTLAERIPGFEALRMQGAWAGYYEMNTFDHNAIVGLSPDCDNLVFANGFSGHGLQQCPAVGRGVAELLLTGSYQSLDLSPLSITRIAENRPLLEKNVI